MSTFPREQQGSRSPPRSVLSQPRRSNISRSVARPGRGRNSDEQKYQTPIYAYTNSPAKGSLRTHKSRPRDRTPTDKRGRDSRESYGFAGRPPDTSRRGFGVTNKALSSAFELSDEERYVGHRRLLDDGDLESSSTGTGTESFDTNSERELALDARDELQEIDGFCVGCERYALLLQRKAEQNKELEEMVKRLEVRLKAKDVKIADLEDDVKILEDEADTTMTKFDEAEKLINDWTQRSIMQEREVQELELVVKELNQSLEEAKKKKHEAVMSVKEHDQARPNVQRVQTLVKVIKEKNLKVVNRGDWPALKIYLQELQHQESWPDYLLDLEVDEWDPAEPETTLHKKLRTEMYMVLRDAVDWKKHGSKMNAVLESEVKHNGQALFRRLDGFFAVGREDGDVTGAGVAMRQHTMASSKMNVVDYGLELERLVKVLVDLGLPPNINKEVIPQYTRGLLKSFDAIRTNVENKLEDDKDWDPTLRDVMDLVERRANKHGMLDLVSKGKELSQNGQQLSRSQKRKEAKKAKEAVALVQKTKNAEGKKAAKAETGQLSATVDLPCNHGSKCWIPNCKFKHEAGHKPAKNPKDMVCSKCKRSGHEAGQCGKCFRCGTTDHIYKDCPLKAKPRNEGQTTYQGVSVNIQPPPANQGQRGVLMQLSSEVTAMPSTFDVGQIYLTPSVGNTSPIEDRVLPAAPKAS